MLPECIHRSPGQDNTGQVALWTANRKLISCGVGKHAAKIIRGTTDICMHVPKIMSSVGQMGFSFVNKGIEPKLVWVIGIGCLQKELRSEKGYSIQCMLLDSICPYLEITQHNQYAWLGLYSQNHIDLWLQAKLHNRGSRDWVDELIGTKHHCHS